jgi:hypothetical protein
MLSGVGFVALYDTVDWQRTQAVALRSLVLVSICLSLVSAVPFIPAGDIHLADNRFHALSPSDAQTLGTDLEGRIESDATVFTVQPLYPIHADRKATAGLSREYWLLLRAREENPVMREYRERVIRELRRGDASHVIVDVRMELLFDRHPELESAVEESYCPVSDDELFEREGANLFVRADSAPNCA